MSYDNARIELTDSPMSAMMKMADGNPGAITVLLKLLEQGEAIDPDAAFGGFANIMSLDTHDIYGSEIWMFYKDLCDQDLINMIGLMRAVQLGFLSESALRSAIQQGAPSADWITEHVAKVREYLPNFGKVAVAA